MYSTIRDSNMVISQRPDMTERAATSQTDAETLLQLLDLRGAPHRGVKMGRSQSETGSLVRGSRCCVP